ncbi:MAG TPA: hypothetical protein VIJ87_19605, partial [Pyrinomonadaceae bacterium]
MRPNELRDRNQPADGSFSKRSSEGRVASYNTFGMSEDPENCDRPAASKKDEPMSGRSYRFTTKG